MFEWLYDDEAPGPMDTLKSTAKKVGDWFSDTTDKAGKTETGKHVGKAAQVGLVIGVGVGVVILVTGTAMNLVGWNKSSK